MGEIIETSEGRFELVKKYEWNGQTRYVYKNLDAGWTLNLTHPIESKPEKDIDEETIKHDLREVIEREPERTVSKVGTSTFVESKNYAGEYVLKQKYGISLEELERIAESSDSHSEAIETLRKRLTGSTDYNPEYRELEKIMTDVYQKTVYEKSRETSIANIYKERLYRDLNELAGAKYVKINNVYYDKETYEQTHKTYEEPKAEEPEKPAPEETEEPEEPETPTSEEKEKKSSLIIIAAAVIGVALIAFSIMRR